MGKDFFENSQIAKDMIKNASEKTGIDFEKLLFEENEDINQTQYTQPAILLVSAIAVEIFKSQCDIKPEFVLGHSLGEFSALVAAGGMNYLDAVELTNKRGQFMSDACDGIGAGMMALLGMEDEAVEALCERERANGKKVWAANYNSDGQVVLAGSKADLESLVEVFKEAGAKRAIVLPMSVASHCPILEPAIANLTPYLDKINDSFEVSVISNVTTKPYNTKEEAIKLLSNQLVMPVRYKQSILSHMDKVDMFIEFGNGNVLKGLNKKGVTAPTLNVSDMKTLQEVIEAINE
jgi:[acyl-carrier-protein] S-malonyltransferase